ncbi:MULTISPECIES: ATP-binding protein [unclassified Streptomyces]|jgi:CO dehydrogenase maturation factor|uniref:ATP-binding protein n=1 Tax=unclassified Streptomyces TaxID=2593676 RepID=UPI0004C571AA|nr:MULTISPECIES: ATP-binding protein [unclassified Streptomyces]MDX2733085.1 ATP-binding protein [Streptomyces sp. PA03-2a]MDX3770250.1 ATP-binding protein [Streptomyces sp. AK08-01B]MDX3819521.1 ATP-binding protein [Streptomyces sp. AK08-01A]WSQ28840.1 ATP-binding protein [Streptomyces sp. NBC_01230]SCZ13042.1 CO dehydrogenase maturation factor [Streptomyces sp. 136MFCol5.1]
MKIAFVGKGGSGKTTLSSLFIRHLAANEAHVVAVDADINQHLGAALGLDDEEAATLPAMGAQLPLIKEYLRGSNSRIASVETMIKTTPPGEGSRLLRVREDNPVYDACARTITLDDGDIRLMTTGPFTESDLGVACYHSKVGAVELCLNHLVDGPDEYVVVDMTAGSDSFASGMFTRFDMTFLVAEPTRKGVSVYRQYKEYARDFGVALKVVGNKVQGQDDLDFLRAEVGDDLLVSVGHSDWVRAMEKGRPARFELLEADNRMALQALQDAAEDSYGQRDWERYTRQMVHFHLKNAESWGNEKTGADLAAQVDPSFVLDERSARAGAAQPV